MTVTDELPGAMAATVMSVPDTDAVATPGFDDAAEYASASPLGSVKHAVTVAVSPALTVICGMGPQAVGGSWFSQEARASRGRMARRFILELLLVRGEEQRDSFPRSPPNGTNGPGERDEGEQAQGSPDGRRHGEGRRRRRKGGGEDAVCKADDLVAQGHPDCPTAGSWFPEMQCSTHAAPKVWTATGPRKT